MITSRMQKDIYIHIVYIIDIILFAQHNGIQERVFEDDTSNYSRIGPEHEHTVDETKPQPTTDQHFPTNVDRPRGEIRETVGRNGPGGAKRWQRRQWGGHVVQEETAIVDNVAQREAEIQPIETGCGARELRG